MQRGAPSRSLLQDTTSKGASTHEELATGEAAARGGGPRVTGDPLATASTYLGIPRTDLETKLRAGQTLAQIANATAGKNRDGLFNSLVSDATAKIDAAQKAGTITADQATQLKSNLSTRMAQLVDSTGPIPFRRGR